ncbi:MAG: SDR family oxidoreductase [Myxococcota bacterium]
MDQTASSLEGWALVLGASSGFGEAASLSFASAGMDVIGVHLDRRSTMPNVERIRCEIEKRGRSALFFNIKAADEAKRRATLDAVAEQVGSKSVRVLLHSLAFGTLLPFWSDTEGASLLTKRQLDMTLDVMANSLVYWTQDMNRRDLFAPHGRIYAMTSAGSTSVWSGYGAVSAAKSALEAHVRQLAVELAPKTITVNAICAGVTDTPALRKIPDAEAMIATALRKNPNDRLTTPADVADSLLALAQPCTHWLTGNTLYVDGGEIVGG